MRGTGFALALPALLLVGCMPETTDVGTWDGEEDVGEVSAALALENRMAPNALHPNALHPNALHPNALHPNALTPESVSSGVLSSIQDPGDGGTLSRMLLKYIVSCALTSAQTFSFSWTDSDSQQHNETYVGAVGLAPGWTNGPLSAAEERWISACVGARTNYYGVTVVISMRGTNSVTSADQSERDAYPLHEGAFWGNLFDPSPWMHSCNVPANVDAVRGKQRDCAMGHVNGEFTVSCGVLARRGSCASLCADRTNPANVQDDGFASCDGVSEVIATFLPP